MSGPTEEATAVGDTAIPEAGTAPAATASPRCSACDGRFRGRFVGPGQATVPGLAADRPA